MDSVFQGKLFLIQQFAVHQTIEQTINQHAKSHVGIVSLVETFKRTTGV